MRGLITAAEWSRSHKKKVLAHGFILCAFLLYMIFLAGPVFDRFEVVIPGEAGIIQSMLPDETGNVRYRLELVVVSQSALEIHGWAFIDGYNDENMETYVVLRSDRASYVFDTSAVYNNTVTDRFGGPDMNLDWTGFVSIIPQRKIPNGEYVIGLYITRDGIEAMQYTSREFVKTTTGITLAE